MSSEATTDSGWLLDLASDRIESVWNSARTRVDELRRLHPGATLDDLANCVIDDAAFWAAIVGIGVGAVELIPAVGQYLAFAAVAPELIYLVKIEFDTALHVAAIYERNLSEERLVPTLLACLVYSLGHQFVKDVAIDAGCRLTRRALESVLSGATLAIAKRIAAALGVEVTKKGLLNAIPLVAIPINSALNYGGLQLFGRMTKHYFSPNWLMCGACGHVQPRRNRFCSSCATGMGN